MQAYIDRFSTGGCLTQTRAGMHRGLQGAGFAEPDGLGGGAGEGGLTVGPESRNQESF